MKLKNSLSPYPILSSQSDDFVNNIHFVVDIKAKEVFSEIEVTANFMVEDKVIMDLIKSGKASFVLHLESPITSYREIFRTQDNQIRQKIKPTDILDYVEISTFIIAEENISGYYSPNFHQDYRDYTFEIYKGDLLAIGKGIHSSIEKKNEFERISSIIRVRQAKDKNKDFMYVDLDSDYIVIVLPEHEYNSYCSFGKYAFKSTVLALTIVPAMISVLSQMEGLRDSRGDSIWFRSLEVLLEKNGVDVAFMRMDANAGKNYILRIVQQIFSNPLLKSFDEMERMENRD